MLTIGELAFDAPAVMGILNVTPDSFSDGGRFVGRDAALRQAETMARDGAAMIDIGGESTRPGAADVSAQEELDRVLPVIEAVTAQLDGNVCTNNGLEQGGSSMFAQEGAAVTGADTVVDLQTPLGIFTDIIETDDLLN